MAEAPSPHPDIPEEELPPIGLEYDNDDDGYAFWADAYHAMFWFLRSRQ